MEKEQLPAKFLEGIQFLNQSQKQIYLEFWDRMCCQILQKVVGLTLHPKWLHYQMKSPLKNLVSE